MIEGMIEGALLGLLICGFTVGATWLVCLLLTPRDEWPWRSPWE